MQKFKTVRNNNMTFFCYRSKIVSCKIGFRNSLLRTKANFKRRHKNKILKYSKNLTIFATY